MGVVPAAAFGSGRTPTDEMGEHHPHRHRGHASWRMGRSSSERDPAASLTRRRNTRKTIAAAIETKPMVSGTIHFEFARSAKLSRKGALPPSGSTSHDPRRNSTANESAPSAKRVS